MIWWIFVVFGWGKWVVVWWSIRLLCVRWDFYGWVVLWYEGLVFFCYWCCVFVIFWWWLMWFCCFWGNFCVMMLFGVVWIWCFLCIVVICSMWMRNLLFVGWGVCIIVWCIFWCVSWICWWGNCLLFLVLLNSCLGVLLRVWLYRVWWCSVWVIVIVVSGCCCWCLRGWCWSRWFLCSCMIIWCVCIRCWIVMWWWGFGLFCSIWWVMRYRVFLLSCMIVVLRWLGCLVDWCGCD